MYADMSFITNKCDTIGVVVEDKQMNGFYFEVYVQ